MGRIPTSGYCLTCRKRRVKCDRGRPACQRCLKSGHCCKGYEAVFVRMDKRCLIPVAQPIIRGPDALTVTSWGPPKTTHDWGSPSTANHALFGHFLSNYQWGHWWKYIFSLGLSTDHSGAAFKSAEALLMGFFATHHEDDKLLMNSRRIYGESLRLVSQALTFHTRESLALLALPILILSMHPYILDRSIEFEHFIGLGDILLQCGPASFQRPCLLGVFRSCRSGLICQAFAKRRRTLLEEAPWKSIPFKGIGKTSMDLLDDVFSDIPGLYEDAYALESHYSDDSHASLSGKIEILQHQLDDWHTAQAMKASHLPTHSEYSDVLPLAELEPSEVWKLLLHLGPGSASQFGTLDQAIEAVTHRAAVICLEKLKEMIGPKTKMGRTGTGTVITRDGRPQNQSPTYLDVAINTVRQFAYISKELERQQMPFLVAPVAVAIIYCALTDMGDFGRTLAVFLAKICHADWTLPEMEAFKIWSTT